jgi:formylglycine-generating enzyme required for sulfatase activity
VDKTRPDKVYKGGSWKEKVEYGALPYRYSLPPACIYDDIGFRIVRRRSALERLLGSWEVSDGKG